MCALDAICYKMSVILNLFDVLPTHRKIACATFADKEAAVTEICRREQRDISVEPLSRHEALCELAPVYLDNYKSNMTDTEIIKALQDSGYIHLASIFKGGELPVTGLMYDFEAISASIKRQLDIAMDCLRRREDSAKTLNTLHILCARLMELRFYDVRTLEINEKCQSMLARVLDRDSIMYSSAAVSVFLFSISEHLLDECIRRATPTMQYPYLILPLIFKERLCLHDKVFDIISGYANFCGEILMYTPGQICDIIIALADLDFCIKRRQDCSSEIHALAELFIPRETC